MLRACDARHTDVSSYETRDLVICLRFHLHNVALYCLAVASERGQECDRSTVYGLHPLLLVPTVRVLVPPRCRPPQSSVELPARRTRPSRLGDPLAGTHVAVAMACVHSSVTRRELSCAGSVCQQVNLHG